MSVVGILKLSLCRAFAERAADEGIYKAGPMAGGVGLETHYFCRVANSGIDLNQC